MSWNQNKQSRFDALRVAEREERLSDRDREELGRLTHELDELEAAYLTPATDGVRQEREVLATQNRELQTLLRERQAYLAEIRQVVSELERRDREWCERFEHLTGRPWTARVPEAVA